MESVFRFSEGFAVNKSVDQKRIELHEREVVGFEEQLQIYAHNDR